MIDMDMITTGRGEVDRDLLNKLVDEVTQGNALINIILVILFV